MEIPRPLLKKIEKSIKKVVLGRGLSKKDIEKVFSSNELQRFLTRNLKRNKKLKIIPDSFNLKQLEELYYNIIQELHFNVKKKEAVDELELPKLNDKIESVTLNLTNNLSTKILDSTYETNGFLFWIWRPSTNKNINLEHAQYYGLISPIGFTPSETGDFPQFLPFCKCTKRYLTKKEALRLGYEESQKRYPIKT